MKINCVDTILRNLQGFNPQLLKDFAYFWETPIPTNNFQWLIPKKRYVKIKMEDNLKESRL